MTTVAWDGKTLASDSRCTSGSTPEEVDKIFRLKSGVLFGAAGEAGFVALVLEWLENGGRGKRPKPFDHNAGMLAIVVNPDGSVCEMDNYLGMIRVRSKLLAFGSGGDKARALMESGMTAPQAVQTIIDKQLDVYTGGAVQTLELVKKKRRKGAKPHPRRSHRGT